jgi:hypothetical protein
MRDGQHGSGEVMTREEGYQKKYGTQNENLVNATKEKLGA